ncbi:hypothetical protein B0I37DRAFT_232740 [Chaetomium sp. MPI-CAGE-AT-0009]|nr:hypothetical protein B0I37DRAFT_232740 [Chaetomium sp. MPI-CAGE-AT-0009]
MLHGQGGCPAALLTCPCFFTAEGARGRCVGKQNLGHPSMRPIRSIFRGLLSRSPHAPLTPAQSRRLRRSANRGAGAVSPIQKTSLPILRSTRFRHCKARFCDDSTIPSQPTRIARTAVSSPSIVSPSPFSPVSPLIQRNEHASKYAAVHRDPPNTPIPPSNPVVIPVVNKALTKRNHGIVGTLRTARAAHKAKIVQKANPVSLSGPAYH